MSRHVLAAFGLAVVSCVANARSPVYTGTGGSVDLVAFDSSGADSLLLVAPPGPISFGIGGSVTTPAHTGMFGDSTVTITPLVMSMVGAVGGGSPVSGGVSGIVTADIFFTLTAAIEGTFLAGFTIFDGHPLLDGLITLSGPNAASVALGTHIFDAGDYHLHAELSLVGIMAPPDTSGHVAFGAMISFVPMPTGAGLAVAGLACVGGVRRRR